MTRVASFDVFDTLLTRSVGGPRQVFVATGQRLRDAGLIDVGPAAYAAAREEAIRDLTPDVAHHPTLGRIADEVTARLGLPSQLAQELAAAEIEVERAVCCALPGALLRVEQSRRDTGRNVVFVSDTPLPTAIVCELLARAELFREGDRVYASADQRASKQAGTLYDAVAADLGITPAELIHVGDDRWADVANARLHGWNASLEPRGRLTAREHDLDQDDIVTQGLGPRLAAASRMGRLRAELEGVDNSIASIAGSVALPLLTGFGLWVLRQARLLELDRLYFLSRDGEIFREVTHRLGAHAHNSIECRYLYGSRRAWQLASMGAGACDPADLWIPDDARADSLTAQQLLSLVDVSLQEARDTTNSPSILGWAKRPLGEAGLQDLQQLMREAPLATEIGSRLRRRRDLMVRYLEQEGVTGPERVGLVDVGWTGGAARSFEDVLIDAGRPVPAAHLFLGLSGSAPARMGADLYERSFGWLIDEGRGRRARCSPEDPVMMIESFAMGTEGHTVGYALQGDAVVPQLAEKENPAATRWQHTEYRQALSVALDALMEGPALDQSVDLRPLVWRQLLNFWRQPSRAEAVVWGAQPYGEDFHNASSHPLATPVTARRLLARLGVGRAAWQEPTYWLAGTIALSSRPLRWLLGAAHRGRRFSPKLRRVVPRLRAERALRRHRGVSFHR